MRQTRREFMKSVGLVGAAAAVSSIAASTGMASQGSRPKRGVIAKRDLGATGEKVSILGIGCASFGKDDDNADRVINRAIDLGITYLDTAPSYENGRAEQRVGRVMKTRRSQVFLNTKTLARTRDGTLKGIEHSLRRLQTDVIDMVQLHAVNSEGELTQVMGPGGALEGLEKAKDQGKIRFIGITNHRRPSVMLQALDQYQWDAILIAVGVADSHLHDFAAEVVPKAVEKKVGIVAMKVMAGVLIGSGGLADAKGYLRWALSLPISTAIVGMRKVDDVVQNVANARTFRPLRAEEKAQLEADTKEYGTTQALWWKR